MTRVQVKQKPDEEVPVEILATAILEIAKGMERINRSRLTREALVTLIADKSKVAKGTVHVVLNNLDALERNFLKKKLPKGN